MPSSTMPPQGGVEYQGQWYTLQEWSQMGMQSQVGGSSSSSWTGTQQSIYDIINNQLNQWGISGLGNTLKDLLTQGLNQDAIMVQLENSDAFKQRFAGNQIRIKNGLGVLSPADYIATENAYDQVLRQYGINDAFSTRDNFAKWIGGDVSATELQTRAQAAHSMVSSTDPAARNLLNDWYGIHTGDIMSTFLDPNVAADQIDKKIFSANIGAAMQRSGLGTNQNQAESLYGSVSQDQAINGIQNAGQTFARTQALAERYGTQYTAQDALNQYVLGAQGPAQLQQQLAQREAAQFARGSGFTASNGGVSAGSF